MAKSLGLQVTGVLGVLLRAKEAGQLPSLQPVIEELTQNAGFRVAPELLAKSCKHEEQGRSSSIQPHNKSLQRRNEDGRWAYQS